MSRLSSILMLAAATSAAPPGADADSAPFIAFSAAASGRSFADLSGPLVLVHGAPDSSDLVPVTITSLGHIRARVTGQAVRADVPADVSANWVGRLVRTPSRAGAPMACRTSPPLA